MARKIRQEPNKKETPAQFQEQCAQLALELLWQEKQAKPPEINIPRLHIPLEVSRNGHI